MQSVCNICSACFSILNTEQCSALLSTTFNLYLMHHFNVLPMLHVWLMDTLSPHPTPPVCNSHLLPAECVYFLCNIMDRNLRFNIWQLRYFLIQRPKCVLPNSKEGRNVNVKCSLATDQHSRSHSFVSWIYNQKCFTQKRFFSFLILQINEDYATRNNHSCTFSPFIDED